MKAVQKAALYGALSLAIASTAAVASTTAPVLTPTSDTTATITVPNSDKVFDAKVVTDKAGNQQMRISDQKGQTVAVLSQDEMKRTQGTGWDWAAWFGNWYATWQMQLANWFAAILGH